MKFRRWFAAAVVLPALAATAPRARAGEAEGFGVSVDGYVAPVWDDSVTSVTGNEAQRRSRGLAGFATLANLGELAGGGVVDGFPGIFGNGRLTVGGLAGWQPQAGSHRFQLLAELGAERFSDVGGNLLSAPGARDTWLPYLGARLGTSEVLGPGVPFELGVWMFVRKDIDQATVSEPTVTDYRLGGYTAGAALRVGVRFDQKRVPSGLESPEGVAGI